MSATKRATGDPLVSKQPDFRGHFRFLTKTVQAKFFQNGQNLPKRPKFAKIGQNNQNWSNWPQFAEMAKTGQGREG